MILKQRYTSKYSNSLG